MAGFGRNFLGDQRRGMRAAMALIAILTVVVSLIAAPRAHGQNDKKKKKNPPMINNDNANPVVPLTDEQQIDYMLSEYLGAWQLGDVERLHKNYSEDVSVVNGGWAPPITGWTNFLTQYQQQRSHMQKVRMDRMSTYIKVNGTTAWTCYEWEFAADVDGAPMMARGHTTLVLTKKETRWLIVHDHTSVVQTAKANQPGSGPANTPVQPTSGPAKPPSQ